MGDEGRLAALAIRIHIRIRICIREQRPVATVIRPTITQQPLRIGLVQLA